jgi:adenylate cyclase
MTDVVGRDATLSGAELARRTDARLVRASVLANGAGGLLVFTFGLLSPGSPDGDDVVRMGVMNAVVFALFVATALPLGNHLARKRWRGLARWLATEQPATPEVQGLALAYPLTIMKVALKIWGAAALVFIAVNATYSAELAISAGVVALLGGTVCCALLYLLVERITRPVVARALAGRAPPRTRGPSVSGRLTMAWTLVSAVPLVGIAATVIADLAGDIDTLATVSMLLLALVGLGVGLWATVLAARSVGDPVRAVQNAMVSVERGDFDARVPVDDGSEIGRLQAGFNRMAAGLAERERMRDVFGRHVGHDVAQAALEGDLRLGGEEREVAVLFIDVIGSTTLATRVSPAEVVALLNTFFGVVVEVVERHGGWVNKFEGDAALCVFGAPNGREDPAGDALAAARDLRARLAAAVPELDAGIGVSAGAVVAGNIGAEQRFEYTVIGDPVNEAARLCELAKKRLERVLASGSALQLASDAEHEHWSLGEDVELRGRGGPTRLATPVEAAGLPG